MKELWLARDEGGYHLFYSEPTYKKNVPYVPFPYWYGDTISEDINAKALGLPTIRKGTKKKVRITVEEV